jgi:hypothetical protein
LLNTVLFISPQKLLGIGGLEKWMKELEIGLYEGSANFFLGL